MPRTAFYGTVMTGGRDHGLLAGATRVSSTSTAPVYRLWNRRADTNHRYTIDPAIRAAMLAQGWIAEGYGPNAVAMCAPP